MSVASLPPLPRAAPLALALFGFLALPTAPAVAAAPGSSSADDAKALAQAWADLGGDQAAADRAIAALLKLGKPAAVDLEARLCQRPDAAEVERLLKQLDDDRYEVRERATATLRGMGRAILPELQAAQAKAASAEVRHRLTDLLDKPAAPALTPQEEQRHRRAVQVLAGLPEEIAGPSLLAIAQRSPWPETAYWARSHFERLAQSAMRAAILQAQRLAVDGDLPAARKQVEAAIQRGRAAGVLDDEAAKACRQGIEDRGALSGRLASLRNQVRKDATQTAAVAELIGLLFADADLPEEAAALFKATPVKEIAGTLRRALELTAIPAERRTPGDWLALADACAELSGPTGPLGRPALLRRAVAAYARYLSLDTTGPGDAEQRQRVTAAVSTLTAALADLEAGMGGWTNLLRALQSEKHLKNGKWELGPAGLRLASSDFGVATIPVQPEGSYELRVDFVRREGADGIFIALPLGTTRGNLNLSGWTGEASGFEWIDGQEAQNNETTVKPGTITNGKTYSLVARVTVKEESANVEVTLDGKPYLKWSGEQSRISTASAWSVGHPMSLAVGAHRCDIEFKAIRLRMLDGKAKVLEDIAVP